MSALRTITSLLTALLLTIALGLAGACGGDVADPAAARGGCPKGFELCGDACADTQANPLHCGGCDASCKAGEVCSAGQCAEACPIGFVACEGGCIAPDTDSAHCGATGSCKGDEAGKACGDLEGCSGGKCVSTKATLDGLSVSPGGISPAFYRDTTIYTTNVPIWVSSLTVVATFSEKNKLTIDGVSIASGTPFTVPLSAGVSVVNLAVTAQDGSTETYAIVASHLTEITYVKASNTGTEAAFGSSVAMDGDTMAIGASGEKSNATGVDGDQTDVSRTSAGAVYVFRRKAGHWSQEAYLKASNTASFQLFGTAIALSGDTLAVGAYGEASSITGTEGDPENTDTSMAYAGAVYVFKRANGAWVQEGYLKASATDLGDSFGSALAIHGDRIAVGAPHERSNATGIGGDDTNDGSAGAGAAYVFRRNGSKWSQEAYVKASNTAPAQNFGTSVALTDDTLAVGAPGDKSNATVVDGDDTDVSLNNVGAVHVFKRDGNDWTPTNYIKPSNSKSAMLFGTSVAMSGNTLVVGATGEASKATGIDGDETDFSMTAAGAAYVFIRSGTTWEQQAYIKASNTRQLAYFGGAVALDGDTLIVASRSENSNATGIDGNQFDASSIGAGAAYAFVRANGSWGQKAYLKATNTSNNQLFGASVAASGGSVAIGAPQENSGATDVGGNAFDKSAALSGAAFVY